MIRHTIEIVHLHTKVFQSLIFRLLTHLVQSFEFIFYSLSLYNKFVQPQITVLILVYQMQPVFLVFLWNAISSFSFSIHISHLIKLQSCHFGNKLPQFFLGCLIAPTADRCRRSSKTYFVSSCPVSHEHTSDEHGNLCSSSSGVCMCLVKCHPSQCGFFSILLFLNEFFVFISQQDILQHGGIGEKDIRRMRTEFITGSNHMRVFLLNDISIFISRDATYGIHFPHHLIITTVRWFGNTLGHIAIIYCKRQLRACKQFFHTRLLVFHQGIKGIEEDGLHCLFPVVVYQVLHER